MSDAAGASAGPVVVFPDDYPNSVRHFLLIGFLAMFIGAGCFFYLGLTRKVNSLFHTVVFFICAVTACSYYANWSGLGVEYKTTDETPRVIFWSRYFDWVVTGPLIVSALALQSKSDTPTLIQLSGNMVLYEICSLIGAMTVAPYKFMWWVASLIFLGLVFMTLMQRLNNPEGYGGEHLKAMTYLVVCCFCVYPIVWIIGSEGTAALGLSQQTGLLCITDVVVKLGFSFYLIQQVDADEASASNLNQSSQQYV